MYVVVLLTEVISLTSLESLCTCKTNGSRVKMKANVPFYVTYSYTPTQYALDCICVLAFLIYEMTGMRNEFGKRNGAFAEGRASPSFLASYVCSTFFSPLLYHSHYPSFPPFPDAEETVHLSYSGALLGEVVESFIKVGSYLHSLCFKLALSG